MADGGFAAEWKAVLWLDGFFGRFPCSAGLRRLRVWIVVVLAVVRWVGTRRTIQLAPGDRSAVCGYSAFTAAPA